MEIEIIDLSAPWGEPSPRPEPSRPRRRHLPARVRATLAVVAVGGLVALVGAGLLQGLLVDRLHDERDRRLDRRLDALATVLDEGTIPSPLPPTDDGTVGQILQSPGVVVASSAEVAAAGLMSSATPRRGATVHVDGTVTFDGTDRPARIALRTLPTPPGVASSTVLEAAEPTEPTERRASRTRFAVAVGAGVAVAGAGLVTWTVVGRRRRTPSPTSPPGPAPPSTS